MLFQKNRTNFDIINEHLSKSTIEESKTPQNENIAPTVRKTAHETYSETSDLDHTLHVQRYRINLEF